MCPVVSLQVSRSEEALLAQRAAVRPLSRVDALVTPQVTGIREGLVALRALVRPLATVDAQVPLEVA